MYKRILVPVDGSETANRALRTAVALAAEQSAALHVVHVSEETPLYVSMDTLPYPPADLMEALHKEGEGILAEAVATARNQNIEADAKLLVIDGPGRGISEAIEQQAEHWNADLIVIGTHGRRGFRRVSCSEASRKISSASRPSRCC